MTTEKKTLSFGHYLQAIRLEKGISIDFVSRETKINKDTLILIEKEAHEQLPAKVYVKGFLKSYAKVIGADGNEAVRRYMACRDVLRGAAISEDDLAKSGLNFWLRLFLSICGLLCISFLSILILSPVQPPVPAVSQLEPLQDASEKLSPVKEESQQERQKPEVVIHVPVEPEKAIPENEKAENDPVPILNTLPKEEAIEKPASELLLVILTVENTWIRILIDDKVPKEYSLQPGDRLSLKALSRFNLNIGNATGVKLTLNGKPVEVTGRRGEVVSIRIP